MRKTVFFDLDGTLLDTLPDIHESVNEMLKKFGYPEISLDETRSYVGDGARKLIERAVPKDVKNFEECFSYFSENFSEGRTGKTSLFEGERAALDTLKGRGVQLAVITNKPQDAAKACLRHFFPEDFFAFIGGDSGMFDVKPDPSLTRYAALTLKTPLSECVFVGDGEADVLTAKNCKIRGIFALWGYRTRAQLEKFGAKEFAENFSELVKMLEG